MFKVTRSCYSAQRLRRRTPDVERLRLRSRVSELFSQSRSAAGSRSILSLMRDDGEQLGRFKVRSLMRELDLVSKQPGSHAYKKATVERLDIPNTLNREFDVPVPNQVWCGDITYIWAQGKWHYLAVVLGLRARRVVGWALSEKPDADMVIKALDMAYEQGGRRKASGPVVSLGSRVAVCEPSISPAAVALSHAPEHESPRKLLGQRANGARVSQLENGMDTDHWLQNGSRSPARYQPILDVSVQLGSTSSIQRWAGASSGRRKT